jgi:hypothetical protein
VVKIKYSYWVTGMEEIKIIRGNVSWARFT